MAENRPFNVNDIIGSLQSANQELTQQLARKDQILMARAGPLVDAVIDGLRAFCEMAERGDVSAQHLCAAWRIVLKRAEDAPAPSPIVAVRGVVPNGQQPNQP